MTFYIHTYLYIKNSRKVAKLLKIEAINRRVRKLKQKLHAYIEEKQQQKIIVKFNVIK